MKRRTVVTLLGVLMPFLIFANANAAWVGYFVAGDFSKSFFLEYSSLADMKTRTNETVHTVDSPSLFFDGIASDGDVWVGFWYDLVDNYYEYPSFVDMVNGTNGTYTFTTSGIPFSAIASDGDAPGPVPVPATMLLLGSGLIGLAGFRRKDKK